MGHQLNVRQLVFGRVHQYAAPEAKSALFAAEN